MRIMISDEDIIFRKKTRQQLEKWEHEVVDEAINGLQTYQKYMESHPDLLLINLNISLFDALTTINKIISSQPKAKIVVYGHPNQKALILKALDIGAVYFLKLPVSDMEIQKMLSCVQGVQ